MENFKPQKLRKNHIMTPLPSHGTFLLIGILPVLFPVSLSFFFSWNNIPGAGAESSGLTDISEIYLNVFK